ncbi:MAG: hypothetical protein ACYDAJ_07265 [Nitrosotalea sp.]
MNNKRIALIIISAIIAALLPNITGFFNNNSLQTLPITEEAVYDPICTNSISNRLNLTSSCPTDASIASHLGLSEVYVYNPNFPMKTLFLKINLTEIPNSNYFIDNRITEAKLNLKTSYLIENQTKIEFSTHHMFCENSSWNVTTKNNELPCMSEAYYAKSPSSDFTDSYTETKISEKNIDVRNEIEYARENQVRTFTELIQFNPVSFITPHVDNSLTECVWNAKYDFQKNDCFGPYQLEVYGYAYGDNGARPNLSIQYTSEPSNILRILITLGVVVTTTVPQIIQDKVSKTTKSMS